MASLPIRYPELGKRFSRLMEAKGWTITQLAAISGPNATPVTFATISRICKGQTRPRPALLARLAELLEVGEAELIGDDAPMSRIRRGTKLSSGNPDPAKAAPRPDTLQGKMYRIAEIQQQIAAAEALKPELARLLDEVGAEIASLKSQTIAP